MTVKLFLDQGQEFANHQESGVGNLHYAEQVRKMNT